MQKTPSKCTRIAPSLHQNMLYGMRFGALTALDASTNRCVNRWITACIRASLCIPGCMHAWVQCTCALLHAYCRSGTCVHALRFSASARSHRRQFAAVTHPTSDRNRPAITRRRASASFGVRLGLRNWRAIRRRPFCRPSSPAKIQRTPTSGTVPETGSVPSFRMPAD